MDNTHADHIHEWIAVVTAVEREISPHNRNPDTIPVSPYPFHHVFKEVPVLFPVERSEIERIHQRDRPSAHRENITNDASHPSRRTIMGINVTLVIMTLHRDGKRCPFAETDNRCIITWAEYDIGAAGRERF